LQERATSMFQRRGDANEEEAEYRGELDQMQSGAPYPKTLRMHGDTAPQRSPPLQRFGRLPAVSSLSVAVPGPRRTSVGSGRRASVVAGPLAANAVRSLERRPRREARCEDGRRCNTRAFEAVELLFGGTDVAPRTAPRRPPRLFAHAVQVLRVERALLRHGAAAGAQRLEPSLCKLILSGPTSARSLLL
jgi:hypothetical protein